MSFSNIPSYICRHATTFEMLPTPQTQTTLPRIANVRCDEVIALALNAIERDWKYTDILRCFNSNIYHKNVELQYKCMYNHNKHNCDNN